MKNNKYILRKYTAILVLLNFCFMTILNAFPQEKCNGMCKIDSHVHECSVKRNKSMKHECCDNMKHQVDEMVNANADNGSKLSEVDCELEYFGVESFSFILPKSMDSNLDLIQVSSLSLYQTESEQNCIDSDFGAIINSQPPIYILKSSFLN